MSSRLPVTCSKDPHMASKRRTSTSKNKGDCKGEGNIINNFYLNNCQNVQLGSHNQQNVVFSTGIGLLENSSDAEHTKEVVIVAMLNSILNPEQRTNPAPTGLQKLETAFNTLYGSIRDKRRFKDIAGSNLLPFLQSLPKKFRLSIRESTWYVEPTPFSESCPSLQMASTSQIISSGSSEQAIHSAESPTKSFCSEAQSADTSVTEEGSDDEDDQNWFTVNRTKRSKHKYEQIPKTFKDKKKPKEKKTTYASVLASPRGKCANRHSAEGGTGVKNTPDSLPTSPFRKLELRAGAQSSQLSQTESTFNSFMAEVDYFRKGHFVLLTGVMSTDALSKAIDILTKIPWLLVLDCDEESRDGGLLSRVEESVNVKRPLHINTWMEPIKISEMATTWILIQGNRAIPESRFENGYRDWLRTAGSSMSILSEEIARFVHQNTVLQVIILWNDENAKYMNNIVCKLDEHMLNAARFVLCLDPVSMNSDSKANAQLQALLDQLEDNIKVMNIATEDLFLGISDFMSKKSKSKTAFEICKLPTASSGTESPIDRQGFAWLREYMDVIYITPGDELNTDADAMDDEAQHFFRGGTLKWETRFAYDSNYLDVLRDATGQVIERIKNLVLKFRSEICTLHHAPGSGGSTLAQRVLWDLRDISPCVQIHIKSGVSPSDIVSRIEHLYEKTHLPIIGLIDGEDEQRVKQLMRSLRQVCFVLLYVKRYPYSMSNKKNTSNTFWLEGDVSKKEASQLAIKFGNFCKEDDKKKALKELSRDVNHGKRHHLYEFGLTAYVHEFTGVQSYVQGYLQLDNHTRGDLLPWQRILGYFSLVYYYGQSSIPCQFFANILGKPPNYVVTLEDFPYEVKQFVVVDSSNGKANDLRICHYLIAKEVLEQLLSRGRPRGEYNGEYLSPHASQNLEQFAISFIDEARKKKVKVAATSNAVIYILVRTFIFRDNKDVGEGETQSQAKKRARLSKLLSDIPSKPPFTERLHILEKLTQSFPQEPNFHAHLGRFYSLSRPNQEQEAIKAFETALHLCMNHTRGKHLNEVDERLRTTMSQVYHMYGMIFRRKLSRYTGRYFGDLPRQKTNEAEFEEKAAYIVQLAEMACERFQQCRDSKPTGQEDSFGYVGEITVRLQVCDYIHRHSRHQNLVDYIIAEKESDKGSSVVTFVEGSIMAIDDLFLECYNIVDPDNIDSSSFNDAVIWHNALLGNLGRGLEELQEPDTIRNRRFKIATKKLKYSKDNSLTVLESVTSGEEIKAIVDIYEEIFEDAFHHGVEDKRALEIDYMQWLDAIRHELFPNFRNIEDVLTQVRRWHSTLGSPMSKFYMFVLTSIVGFGPGMGDGNSENLVEARNLKEDLRKYGRWVTRSRYPREWLGLNGGGIKQLLSNKVYVGNSEGKVLKVTPAPRRYLKVCIGTILPPNKQKVTGYIELDLGNNYVSVQVFFVPLRTELEGPMYVGRRVEFHLGFSFFNGYEAFNVQSLKQYECIGCGAKVEIISSKQSRECPSCKELVFRNESFNP